MQMWQKSIVVLLFFGVLAALMMHPLLANISTHAVGPADYYHFNWNFWWIQTALGDPDLNLYETNYVLTPYDQNLAFHTLTTAWYPVWAVLSSFTGTIAAVNLIIWLIATLNGAVMTGWLRANRAPWGVALIGGVALMALPPMRTFYYSTHLNLGSWFWVPALLWAWKAIADAIQARQDRVAVGLAALMGVMMWAFLHTDSQLPLYAGGLLVFYGPYTLWQTNRRLLLIGVGTLALVLAVLLAWFAGPLPYLLRWEGSLPATDVDGRPGIVFPEGFYRVIDPYSNWTPSLGAFPLLALVVGVVAALRWREKRGAWLWFAAMLPALILALGPTLTIGEWEIALPYRTAFELSDGNLMNPWRVAPAFIIALFTFAALAIGRRWRWWYGAVGLLLVLITTRFFWTGPLIPIEPSYDFYAVIGDEPPNDFVVLEVPTAVGTGNVFVGDDNAVRYQLYAMVHQRRVVNAFVARAALEHFWYLRTDDPLLSFLGQRRDLEPAAARARLNEIVYGWPVGYVVVHQDRIGREKPANGEVLGFLNSQHDLVCPVWLERDAVVYRTAWHPSGCPPRTPTLIDGAYVIDIGAADDVRYILDGWYWAENLPGINARWLGPNLAAGVIVDVPPQDYTIAVTAQAYQDPRTLTIRVNDVAVWEGPIPIEGLLTVSADIPAAVIGDGQAVTIRLAVDATIPAPGDRSLGILVESVVLRPQQ